MALERIVCPNCQAAYDFDESLLGRRVQCDVCNAALIIKGPAGRESRGTEPPAPARAQENAPHSSSGGTAPQKAATKHVSGNGRNPLAPFPGIVKDPLQSDLTPYEVLGIGRGATRMELDAARMRALRNRVPQNTAKKAWDAMLSGVLRAPIDVLLYDEETLARLRPNPLLDASALGTRRRRQTSEAWERQLIANFPDVDIAHSLGVLWYHWALHEEVRQTAMFEALGNGAISGNQSKLELLKQLRLKEGVRCDPGNPHCDRQECAWREDCCSSGPPLEEIWRRVIAYWSMLAATREMWGERLGLSIAEAGDVRSKLMDALRNRLVDQAQRYSQQLGADHPLTVRYRQLEVTLNSELKAAKGVSESGYRTKRGRVCAGVLMLQYLGLLDKVRTQVDELLQKSPKSHELKQLKSMLSPYFPLSVLLDCNKPEEALARIEELPEQERQTKEVGRLRGRAFLLLGRQQVSVGRLDQALENWGEALAGELTDEVRQEIQREVVSTCHTQAMALQNRDPDQAIDILDQALKLVQDPKLELILAKILTEHAISVFNKGQKDLNDNPDTAARRGIVASMQKARDDMERAARMGNKKAAENLPVAESILGEVKKSVWGNRDLEEEANTATARQDWDAAIALLREAVENGASSNLAAVRNKLASLLFSRAVRNTKRAVAMLGAVASHRKMMAEMTDKLKRHHGDHCAMCGKSRSVSPELSWSTVTLPDGLQGQICAACTSALQALEASAPKPSPEALALLKAAEKDLLDAMGLDPGNDGPRKSLKELREVMGVLAGGKGPIRYAVSVKPAAGGASRPVAGSGNAGTPAGIKTGGGPFKWSIAGFLNHGGWILIPAAIWLFMKGCH